MWRLLAWNRLRVPVIVMVTSLPLLGDGLSGLRRPSQQMGPPAPPKQPEMPRALPTPDDAVKLALADIATLPVFVRPFIRYLFFQRGHLDTRDIRIANLTLNYIHRAATIIPFQQPYEPRYPNKFPVLGNGMLLRIDLRMLFPQTKDLAQALVLWEEFSFDPSFSRLITKDTLKFAGLRADQLPVKRIKTLRPVTKTRVVKPAWGEWRRMTLTKDGGLVADDDFQTDYGWSKAGTYDVWHRFRERTETYETGEEVEQVSREFGAADVVRLDSQAIDSFAFQRLQAETRSLAPVVEHRYFAYRALHSIRDNADNNAQVYDIVFGGRYYQLVGTKDTLDGFFADLGVIDPDKLFDRIRSDLAAALVSGVTDYPREVLIEETPSGRLTITGDVRKRDVDIGDDVFANLLTPRRQGREAIGFKRGKRGERLPQFFAANAQNQRVDSVPEEIAEDRTVPDPKRTSLDTFSCLTCHSIRGKDGMQPVVNEVPQLAQYVDIFGDRQNGGFRRAFNSDTIDRLRGKYKGELTTELNLIRDETAEATLRATGPWIEGPDGLPRKGDELPDQTTVCRLAAQHIYDTVGQWWWRHVDAREALRDLGLEIANEEQADFALKTMGIIHVRDRRYAAALLAAIVPPDLREHNGLFVPYDFRLARLAAGLKINRSSWALVRDFAAARAARNPLFVKLREMSRR